MNPRVKITPDGERAVEQHVEQVVNDLLDKTLPSLDEIRAQLAAPAAGEEGSDAHGR